MTYNPHQLLCVHDSPGVRLEFRLRGGKLFGNGARFWINLQRTYDLAIAERTVDVSDIPTLEMAQ